MWRTRRRVRPTGYTCCTLRRRAPASTPARTCMARAGRNTGFPSVSRRGACGAPPARADAVIRPIPNILPIRRRSMSLFSLIAVIEKAFAACRREQAYAELMALDDHTLADIGLRRSDLVAGRYGRTHAIDVVPEPAIAPRRHQTLAHGRG